MNDKNNKTKVKNISILKKKMLNNKYRNNV